MGNKLRKVSCNEETVYQRPNHYSYLKTIREKHAFCDITINVQDKSFRAHKCLLAGTMRFFENLFSNNTSDVIELNNIKASSMEAFINFAYTGQIILNNDNIRSLIRDADCLEIFDIKEACSKFLESLLQPENMLDTYYLSESLDCVFLRAKALKMLQQYFLHALTTQKYLNLEFSVLYNILSRLDLADIPQDQLFEGVIKWIAFDVDTRKYCLQYLLTFIKISDINCEYLLEIIRKDNVLAISNKHNDLEETILDHYKKVKGPESITKKSDYNTDSEMNHILVISKIETSKIETYNIHKDKWNIETYFINTPIRFSCAEYNEKLYLFGGVMQGEVISKVSYYDRHLKTWKSLSSMNTKRRWSGAAQLNDYLYVCGGEDGKNYLNTVEMYNPRTDEWTDVAPMNYSRSKPDVVVFEKRIYVFGGYMKESYLDAIERYNPWTNEWTIVQMALQEKRYYFGVAALYDMLFICGGLSTNNKFEVLASVECYNSTSQRWECMASMKTARHSLLVVARQGKLWAIGGVNHKGCPLSTVEVYDPETDVWSSASSMYSISGRVHTVA